jgi:hypothetical protein
MPVLGGLPSVTDITGVKRLLACRPGKVPKIGKRFGAGEILNDRSIWKRRDYSSFCPPVQDQGDTPACVGFASCTAFTTEWRMRGGDRNLQFSAFWIYENIPKDEKGFTNIADALTCLENKGICLEDEAPQLGSVLPTASDTALQFRIELAYQCPTFNEIATAVLSGWPVAFGVDIDTNHFRALAAGGDGVLPDKEDSTDGHAMCAVGLEQIDGRWYLKVQNSWGLNFGKDGYCYMPESYFDTGVQNWAIQAIFEGPSS